MSSGYDSTGSLTTKETFMTEEWTLRRLGVGVGFDIAVCVCKCNIVLDASASCAVSQSCTELWSEVPAL